MRFTNQQFQKIWDMVLPYQDKRDDESHARVVTEYAQRLLEMVPDVDENIVIPAAILHDIGWANLSEEERFFIFDANRTKESELAVRVKHQDEGVKIAREILEKVEYPKELTENILEIISEHDTRKGFISKEDGLMRDADKLWRYSILGTEADIRRRGITPAEYLDYVEKRIEELGFFYSSEAKKLAYQELAKRREEYGIHN